MEYREGKSIPVVKEFQVESSWGPWTPIRPSLAQPRAIYEEGQNGLLNQAMLRESEDFLSRFSQINQAQTQTHLSGSISSMSWNMENTPNFDDTRDRGNVELQKQGLEEYLPHWNSQERRTIHNYGSVNQSPSNYPCLNSMDLPLSWRNNGVRENVGTSQHLSDDPFGQFDNMSFGDLLGMKGSALAPSIASTRLGDCSKAVADSLFLSSSSTFGNQESLQDLNQQFNGVFGQEMENSASIYQKWNLSNVNSTPVNKHTGGSSTLAPLTPDLLWRSGNSAMSGNASVRTPNEQNRSHENEAAAAEIINLHDLNKEVTEPASDSPGEVSEALAENHDHDKGDLDLNKTPQKKPRRKRYMPKVVNENKPKRTANPKTPKARDSKEPQKPKRTYMRKSKQTPPSTSCNEATETIDPKPTKPAAKSCRKSLKFDLNGQVTEDDSLHKPNGGLNAETQTRPNECHTADPRLGEELVVETSQVGIAYDLNHTLNQELKNYMALPEQHNHQNSHSSQAVLTEERESMMRTDLAPSSNSSPCASSNEGVQTRGSKRAHYENVAVDHGKFGQYNANISEIPGIGYPEICKKRRIDVSYSVNASEDNNGQAADAQNHPGVDPTPSKYYSSNPVTWVTDAVTNNQVEMLMRGARNHEQLLNTWLDISRLKKKRTKSTTRVRDLASLEGIASISQVKSTSKGTRQRNNAVSDSHHLGNSNVFACIEALTEEVHGTPKRKNGSRKGNYVAHSTSSKSNQQWDLVLYDGNRSMKNRRGRTAKTPLIKTASLEAITEGLKLLNINKKGRKVTSRGRNALVPYRGKNTEQNALVPYGNDGTLVPYEGPFDPIRKRRQRAKVELDDETTRVWRLLLENIDNEGIDGTDEEKAKWWENERGVFRGRVDSFIARMRLVQGDRRFTPWKGSVLDSVIGVFLTQNVSDHLSSSAFMNLAARFPIKSDSCESTLSEEGSSTLVVEQEVCITEPEESITWNEKSPDERVCDWKSRVIYSLEEKEDVNGEEIIGGVPGSISNVDHSSESSQRAVNESSAKKENSYNAEIEVAARDDATSSQQSMISSQNTVDSLSLHTGRVMNTFLESNSNCHFNHSTSFLGLLKMAESPFLNDSFSQIFDQDQSELFKHVGKDSLEVLGITPSDYQLYQKSDFHMKTTTGIGMIGVESLTPNALRKDEVSTTEQSNMTPRSSPENVSSCYVLEGEEMIMQPQTGSRKDSPEHMASSQQQSSSIWKSPDVQNSLQGTADVTASTTSLGGANNKEAEHIAKNKHVSSGTSDTKPKKGKAVKDKKNAYDWDELRKQAQVNGHKKERTANTRDSIDWEAIMHADVSVLSETIKERGMNNMLAERIKDLLDRLVKDHGSIDLEWLRDIPPDKAKEYLLSFRGLGLKSVECVRLLTLHHLAFPVDTNVGRIAVRLGWVPLQPLPEQLQLHLLELYPVLESIQKYLWPRLCKLDQKTLYELHYHMITFGKVFCTKRQPNCNACPLRGECRHFASAFASARLALPGPEEKHIVPSVGGSSTHVNSQVSIDPLPLPLWSNHYSEENLRCHKGAPTVEVPSTPLSLPLPQPIHHLERNSQINSEPIVEIPASPERETEQEQTLCDIEDAFYEDPNEIPTIKLNMKEFTQTIQNFMEANRELQETGMSKALVALTPEIASIPTPKLKNISRLRTEHHVYELPDTHPLLKGMGKREPDDPCSYLFAIWTPGETADSIQPPERRCNFDDPSILCNEETCSYCSSQREANTQIVRGTLLIPCRTAMRGSFPLNGTYFQVNEVFADHDSSLKPIDVPRSWLWNLPRRTVYFGTSVPSIFRGLNTEDIQHCFWRGYVCVRGFDQRTRAPRPLMARLHFPASRMPRGGKGKTYDDE